MPAEATTTTTAIAATIKLITVAHSARLNKQIKQMFAALVNARPTRRMRNALKALTGTYSLRQTDAMYHTYFHYGIFRLQN